VIQFDAEAMMIPIEFDAIIFQEGKSFVAHCPELDVSSCGHNVDEARGGLKDCRTLVRGGS
jgi:hypothetical protein